MHCLAVHCVGCHVQKFFSEEMETEKLTIIDISFCGPLFLLSNHMISCLAARGLSLLNSQFPHPHFDLISWENCLSQVGGERDECVLRSSHGPGTVLLPDSLHTAIIWEVLMAIYSLLKNGKLNLYKIHISSLDHLDVKYGNEDSSQINLTLLVFQPV